MSHPDSDLLALWLDHELSAAEAAELEQHLAECPACAARAREERALAAEADRLLADLDDEIIPPEEPEVAEPRPATGVAAGPLVLMPTYNVAVRRHRWRRGVGIAAMLLTAVGAGWMALHLDASGGGSSSGNLSTSPSPAASSPAPLAAAESVAAPAPVTTAAADAPAERERTASAPAAAIARDDVAPPPPPSVPAAPTPKAEPYAPPRFAEAQVKPVEERPESSAGMAQFTAKLSGVEPAQLSEVRAREESRPPVDAEQEALLSSRIGLDEARRQLGGNLHVIDGLRPEMVGLVPGRLVPGADTTRPVVRVVYLASDGRSFFLDQQRLDDIGTAASLRRMAPTPASRSDSWTMGNVRLRLHGALSPDSIAGLARRVK
jgi:anti-sigma factor RsiW